MDTNRAIKCLAAGAVSLLVAAGASSASATVAQPDSTSESAREARFIVEDNTLQPLELAARGMSTSSEIEGSGGFTVTFSVDGNNRIQSKTIEQYASAPEANDAGRDKLSTFVADSDGLVQLDWWDPSEGEIVWSITRDGEEIDQLRGDQYLDDRPDPEVATTYRIEGMRYVDVDGETAEEPYLTLITIPAIDTDPIGELLGASSLSPQANSDVMSTAAGDWTMAQQLNTFIPEQYAATPFDLQPCFEAWGGTGIGRYGGDNRGFAQPTDDSPSVRTGLILYRFYNAIGHQTGGYQTLRTSGTKLYLDNGSILVQKNADLSQIFNVGGSGDETGGNSGWSHHVNDPLCSISPAIDYALTFGSWGDGRVRLYGSHDQAPSYEWRVRSTGSWYNKYQFSSKGLQYLYPTFPQAHVDLNGAVNPG